MRRRTVAIALAAALIAGAGTPASAAAAPPALAALFGPRRPPASPSLVFSYRGWRVDASRAGRGARPDVVVRRIEAQLDLVAKVGLKSDALDFMRGVPILADPTPGAEPGRYVRGSGVLVRVKLLDAKKPIVLRQLLYAYQDQKLPGGFANPEISRFRGQAMAQRVWPRAAAMLRTDADYFAITASAYLAGAITREPYNRANLRKTQPDYYLWLARLFDGGRARM